MRVKIGIHIIFIVIVTTFIFQSCKTPPKRKSPENFEYKKFKDSVNRSGYDTTGDYNNVFDTTSFTPGIDSLNTFLQQMRSLWHRDIVMAEQVDTLLKIWKKEERYTATELETIKENIIVLDSFIAKKATAGTVSCLEKDCLVYVQIIKSTQTM